MFQNPAFLCDINIVNPVLNLPFCSIFLSTTPGPMTLETIKLINYHFVFLSHCSYQFIVTVDVT